ncbi:cytochrome c biogenesis protein CcdA [Chryseobacterium sp. Leaf394]|uniref:protein-disulfide reductase DsbD family protein n=1 Tax=Chryseobacterium sp. Leaf394 TaxID=1736361 RepID=UPI00070182E2|nr:cytochrome c biogenesis protein CcdA [Chryseobacterium sp. Leaf394]KQS94293.1 protein-disulfide reductase [Chryseobacterium sp. Leaf394]
MKFRSWFLLTLLFLSTAVNAQIKDPVKFKFSINELGNNEYEAVLNGTIEKGWHIYSKDIPEDTGGIPTEYKVSGKNIELIGKFTETGKKHSEFSEAFGGTIVYYSDAAGFKQKFKLKDGTKPADVVAEIMYQTCDDRVCLAPNTLEFTKKLTPKGVTEIVTDEKTVAKDSLSPIVDTLEENATATKTTVATASKLDPKQLKISSIDISKPLTDCGTSTKLETNYWKILILGFIGGLIALLTPCVFPMIPLTVSFFTKGNKNPAKGKRDAFVYGFFILLIFVLLSVPFHLIDGIAGNIFNEISTNVWLNILFFVVFIFFAGSFFGYYDITLPSSIANKSSKAEEVGGMIGIFFMALTLVIVSFSCTGPILGSILGSILSDNSVDIPTVLTFALAGFGLAWAIVFGLLALFPQALQSLPKSGGWMNTVKVVLGFIELALALKFLSKADLVSKTFFIKRELFIAIWIIIAIGLVIYLFGLIRFPHDDKKPKISVGRKILGILGIGFVVYLIQGLIPAERPKLQLLSGILPPLNVSYLHDEKDGILGMHPEHDFFSAIELAKKEGKPILIDFTGYGCENCRKMEEFVWSEPDILPILQNDVLIASLYVDDKEELPEDQKTKIEMGDGQVKKVKTIGDRWSLFQSVNFNNNSQPHYVLLTPDGKVINSPVSGFMDKEDFKKFLECGVNFYKNNK